MKFKLIIVSLAAILLLSSTSFAYEKTSYEAYIEASKDAEYFMSCDLVTSTDVNMRTGPGLKYPVYKVLPEGTKVLLNNDEDPSGWYEVWYDENVYFIYGDYIKIIINNK